MADFHQNGRVATLHNLRGAKPETIERELEVLAANRRITLILPSLYSELEGPALANIVEQLSGARFISHIVIGLDRANRERIPPRPQVLLGAAAGALDPVERRPAPDRRSTRGWSKRPACRRLNSARAATSGTAWATRWPARTPTSWRCMTATSSPIRARCWPGWSIRSPIRISPTCSARAFTPATPTAR